MIEKFAVIADKVLEAKLVRFSGGAVRPPENRTSLASFRFKWLKTYLIMRAIAARGNVSGI